MSKKTLKITRKKTTKKSIKKTAAKSAKSAGSRGVKKRAKSASKKTASTSKAKGSTGGVSKTAKPKASTLTEGMTAPNFSLPRDGGQSVSLKSFAGRKLVIFFYPRADTPGCTLEAIAFTRLEKDFSKAGTSVLGVSADPLKAQESFRDKHKLTVPLLSDEKQEMLTAYGAWGEKSMYGKTFMGVLRTTVLIGADGKIVKIWRNVKVDGHADEVLEAARIA